MEIINPYGFIYITTNLINGKRYIGQKKLDKSSRWKSYLGSGKHLLNSIIKYGKDNFVRDIVDIAYTEEQLNKLEIEWINNYNAVECDDFYNKICGGLAINSLNNKNSIKCICIDNGMIFNSIIDASIYVGCSTTKIVNSFTKKHTYNYKKEDLIFRPITYLKEGMKLCCICGKNFKPKSNSQKKCKECATKKPKDYKGICIDCGKEFIKTDTKKKKCNSCSKKKKSEKRRYVKYVKRENSNNK